ncbi:hypothetical protein [Kiloniella antarctica]|uniref:Uncharacterized protein n=1 Tax=Kiloniella antarctica TaxID=1550907 RepID=A0ABW5BK48_9PROT
MNKFKKILLGASVVTLGVGSVMISSNVLAASSGNSEYVDNVNLGFPGYAAVINIKNTSVNNNFKTINLDVLEDKLNFKISGTVTCKDKNNVKFLGAHVYFGGVGIGGLGGLSTSGTLFHDTIDVGYTDGSHSISEYTEDTFTVPLNEVKNGHPALRVDALKELDKKLQAYVQGGGEAIEFYKLDQEVVINRPISLAAICGKNGNNTVGFETKNHTIQIKYEGDPNLKQAPMLNAQLGGNLPNQINQNLPLQLSQATFQPNMPHHIGKCVPDSNPTIRVNYKGTGKGNIRFKVGEEEGNFVIFNSNQSSYNSADQMNRYFDFDYPLIEKMNQDQFKWWKTINKTYNHSLTIKAQVKDQNSDSYGAWKDFGTATFKHRCTPQVKVLTSPGLGGYQGQENSNTSIVKPNLKMKPQRAPLDKVSPNTEKPKRLKIVEPE